MKNDSLQNALEDFKRLQSQEMDHLRSRFDLLMAQFVKKVDG